VIKNQIVLATGSLEPGKTQWKRFPISKLEKMAGNGAVFSHGIGLGDVNNDWCR